MDCLNHLRKQTWHFQIESIGIVSRMYVKKREENWEMGQDGNSEKFWDMYVTRLQDSIRQIKENQEKERQYMMWQDIIDDAKEEGRRDMREPMVAMLKGMLSRFGTLPDEVVRRIDQETDMDKITVWAQLVVKVKSLEDFVDQM